MCGHEWRSEDNLEESVLHHHMPPDTAQVVELGSEHLCPLSHFDGLLLDSLIVFSLKIGQIVNHGVRACSSNTWEAEAGGLL